jgi:hypothetical protein
VRIWIAVLIATCFSIPANASEVASLVPPVDGVVSQRFQAPQVDWGPGHRGIDFTAEAGTAVRAAGPGTVVFAGEVAGFPAVTIDHGNGLETTYSILSSISVAEGDHVEAGRWIGEVGEAHPGIGTGLHFGVKVEDEYVDPESHLAPTDVGGAIHLAPLVWEPPAAAGDLLDIVPGPESWSPGCIEVEPLERGPIPPNDNVAIAVAGIGSHTRGGVSADMYEHGPEWLGYPAAKTYRFSYRGADGAGLHEPYDSADTYVDLVTAAKRLGELVQRVAALHPGTNIDLIAHSQGGIVARSYLEFVADQEAPRVEHLVTFATPHGGAPGAGLVPALDERAWGRLLVDGQAHWSEKGGPIPDPRSDAVEQLAPGSELMEQLGRERTVYGTRVLALAIPNDAIVPADRAVLPTAISRTVPPTGLNGHSGIVTSTTARAIAFGFLRDAPETCRSSWDSTGPWLGRLIGAIESNLAELPGMVLTP